jgi:putative hemolysin
LDGMLAVEEFLELFHLEEWQFEEQRSYQTLGGFVITHLGRIPAAADHFEWEGMRIEVMDMDGNRVDKVLVVPMADQVEDVVNR